MKLQLSQGGPDPHFTGYGEGYVSVGGQRFEHHLLIAPGRAAARWGVASFETLVASDFEALVGLDPELVVLGTGTTLRFPRPQLTRCLMQASIGLEVMDTGAACRTYNILLSEGRRVVAAILLA